MDWGNDARLREFKVADTVDLVASLCAGVGYVLLDVHSVKEGGVLGQWSAIVVHTLNKTSLDSEDSKQRTIAAIRLLVQSTTTFGRYRNRSSAVSKALTA